jgi:hypothetical protein
VAAAAIRRLRAGGGRYCLLVRRIRKRQLLAELDAGIAPLDQRDPMGPQWSVDWPEALPLFLFAAIVGAASSLILVIDGIGQQGNGEGR